MGRKKKREDPPGPAGAPEWVVTFTDMISLLVTFFVLLMTFSSLDAHQAFKVDSLLSGGRGVHSAKGSSMPELGEEDLIAAKSVERGANHPHSRPPEELAESLQEMGQKKTDEHQELDLSNVHDGILIQFTENESFDPGSTLVSASLRKRLVELAKVLEHYPHLVVVEGFTDNAFRASPEFDSAEAISLARAHAAADAMLGASNMTPELLQIAGLGASQPRTDNVSPGGRRSNRRVQIRVLSISKLRATHLGVQSKGDR